MSPHENNRAASGGRQWGKLRLLLDGLTISFRRAFNSSIAGNAFRFYPVGMLFNVLVLVFGVFAASTSVLMIRWSDEHPLLVGSYRLLIAAALLVPLFLRDLRRRGRGYTLSDFSPTLLPALALALHFTAWIAGARMTPAANATLIVNMNPVAMPLFAFLLYREVITLRELAGTAIALAGVVLLGISDFRMSGGTLAGDLLCFGSMVLGTLYLALARKYRSRGSLWLYVVPLYAVSGMFCFVLSLFFTNPFKPYTLNNLLNILALALLPTIVGHTVFNYAMRKFRGQPVALASLGQFVFAGVLGYFLLDEVPAPLFYVSSVLAAGGACLAIPRSGNGQAASAGTRG
jgi:drug/metabolite transporter (DMT)-like permease